MPKETADMWAAKLEAACGKGKELRVAVRGNTLRLLVNGVGSATVAVDTPVVVRPCSIVLSSAP